MTGNQKTIVAVLAVAVVGFVGFCAIAVFAGSAVSAPAPVSVSEPVAVRKVSSTPLLPNPTAVPANAVGEDTDNAAYILKGLGWLLERTDRRGQESCDFDACYHYWKDLALVSLFETDGNLDGVGVFVANGNDVDAAAEAATTILMLVAGLSDTEMECVIDAGEGISYCGDVVVLVKLDADGFFISYVW